MKDCAYKDEGGMGVPCCGKHEEGEERYPSVSIYSPEAVSAIFGKTLIRAGDTFEAPMRIRVTSIRESAEDGLTEVNFDIVAVGNLVKGKPMAEDSKDEGKEA